jgi:hypothetical protein
MKTIWGLIIIGITIYFWGLPPNYTFVIHLTTVILVALHNTSTNHLKTINPINLNGLQMDVLHGRATYLKVLMLFSHELITYVLSIGALFITIILSLLWKLIIVLF